MKLFIASDIHGSELYCRKMLEAFKHENADRLILLGDILYHGPRNDLPEGYNPKTVIELLNPMSERIICVRGNCDAEVDDMVLGFPVLNESALIFADMVTMLAVHGHREAPKTTNACFLLNGHTHIPAFEHHDGYYLVNPGSVSIPKDNSKHSYVVFENDTFIWKSLDGEAYRTEKIR